jgi:hypothetical protein
VHVGISRLALNALGNNAFRHLNPAVAKYKGKHRYENLSLEKWNIRLRLKYIFFVETQPKAIKE